MIDIFINMLACSGIFMTLTGLVLWLHVFKPNRAPMDKSNAIAHLTLVWFAMKSPHKFVDLYYRVEGNHLEGGELVSDAVYEQAFPWLTKDQGDALKGKI